MSFTSFNTMYHSSIKLILEEASNNTFRFLEGKFSMADSQLSCQWFSKNFESLEATGKLKFITSQDYFSYSGNKKKIIQAATNWMADYLIGLFLHWCWYYLRVWVADLWAFCQILPKKGIYIYIYTYILNFTPFHNTHSWYYWENVFHTPTIHTFWSVNNELA